MSHIVNIITWQLDQTPTWTSEIFYVNCYNDILDKVGYNTNITIRTDRRLLILNHLNKKRKKQNKNKILPLEFQITGMQNLHRKSKDADLNFHLQFLWRRSLDPSLLCVWSNRTSKLLFKLSEKLTAQSACWEGWFDWLCFISNWYDRSYQVLYFTYCTFYE